MAFIPKDAIWHIADILEEIRVSGYKTTSLHINTVLIRATSPEDAYKKAMSIGKDCNHSYKNVKNQKVTCKFRGLRNLNVIHEKLVHGAELTWVRRERLTERGIKRLIAKKADLAVFRKIKPLSGPNFMPKTIAEELNRRMKAKSDAAAVPRRRVKHGVK